MTLPSCIDIESLSKTFGKFHALDKLSLRVGKGEVYGFLGPNGAGKTTTMRLLMGMLVPNAGAATIHGLDCWKDRVEVKRRVGYLPDVPAFYDYLTGAELVLFVGRMHGMDGPKLAERADRLLEELELRDAAGDYVTNYSLGMKKKMGLALALIHDPEVLILDEPTTGLDPMATRRIRDLIRSYVAMGRSVLLSTHMLDMAEQICDRVGIIHHGRLVAEGAPSELRLAAAGSAPDGNALEEAFLAITAGSKADS